MPPSTDLFEYVYGSATRREVLAILTEASCERRVVVERCEASESSVYDALNQLDRTGLVAETTPGVWSVTGTGRLVVDALERCTRLQDVLSADSRYWTRHDTAALPPSFRVTLTELDGYDLVRSTKTHPYRVSRLVESLLGGDENVDVVTPIYHDRFADAVLSPDGGRTRLVLAPDVVCDLARGPTGPPSMDDDTVHVRVAPTDFAMTVTDSTLLLSLPLLEGGYDPETELVVDTERAVEWGQCLFESMWVDARDVETFLREELDRTAE